MRSVALTVIPMIGMGEPQIYLWGLCGIPSSSHRERRMTCSLGKLLAYGSLLPFIGEGVSLLPAARRVVYVVAQVPDFFDFPRNPCHQAVEGNEDSSSPGSTEGVASVDVQPVVDLIYLFDLPTWVHRENPVSLSYVRFPEDFLSSGIAFLQVHEHLPEVFHVVQGEPSHFIVVNHCVK